MGGLDLGSHPHPWIFLNDDVIVLVAVFFMNSDRVKLIVDSIQYDLGFIQGREDLG